MVVQEYGVSLWGRCVVIGVLPTSYLIIIDNYNKSFGPSVGEDAYVSFSLGVAKGGKVNRSYGFPNHSAIFLFAGREIDPTGRKGQVVCVVAVSGTFGIICKEADVEIE